MDVKCEMHPGLLVIFGTLLALYLIVFLFTLAIGGPAAVAGSALVVAFGGKCYIELIKERV